MNGASVSEIMPGPQRQVNSRKDSTRDAFRDIVISSRRRPVAEILIRKIPEETKERLRRRAERRGRSLEADLREALEKLAHDEAESPDDAEPFGAWLVSISRPGVDLTETLELLRSAPLRRDVE
jgi:plasmid stability protein